MWETISNVSGLITCILFIAYIIGHIWTIYISKNAIFEKFEFENITDDDDIDYIDLGGEYGSIFSISSPNGIREVKIFGVDLDENSEEFFIKGDFIKKIENIKPNEKLYIKAQFMDFSSNIYLEVQRTDYIKFCFIVADSGRDGSFVQKNLKIKMPFKSWLYYLCK